MLPVLAGLTELVEQAAEQLVERGGLGGVDAGPHLGLDGLGYAVGLAHQAATGGGEDGR